MDEHEQHDDVGINLGNVGQPEPVIVPAGELFAIARVDGGPVADLHLGLLDAEQG